MRVGWPALSLYLLVGLAPAPAIASGTPRAELPVLHSSPGCAQKRLGRVAVTLGHKALDERSAMPATGVSYRRAFRQLRLAAAERGADAVVLRNHDAAWVTQGARRTWRPTYVSIEGAAIRFSADRSACMLEVLDTEEFERDAIQRQRESVRKDTGMDF